MRKVLVFALVMLLSVAGIGNSYAQSENLNNDKVENQQCISKTTYSINAINPNSKNNPIGAYYPGGRAGNQLNIYTSEYGETTGTNEFGQEAIVEGNQVTQLSGSNSFIPPNGFVISGHGRAKKWIMENIIEGAIVNIDKENKIIEVVITPDSYSFKAQKRINEVESLIKAYKKSCKKYKADEAKEYLKKSKLKLDELKSAIEKNEFDKVKTLSEESISYINKALYNTVPSIDNEVKGVWLRPTEKNKDDIVKTINILNETGINNIYLETYYQGYTIFPSKTLEKYGVMSQRKEFQGWDPLAVWIEEAHKNGIKLNIWFQTFYVGNEDITKNPKHVISAHPDWANYQKRYVDSIKPMPSVSEHNGYFIDPANPDVQTYLKELLSEIVANYQIDGLNIDYIRYPVSLPKTFPMYLDSTWGYTKFARNEFTCLYGKDPATLTLDDPLWQKWNEYRQQKVTNFVSSLKAITSGKNISISTVIFPNPEESMISKLQNWQIWGLNNYVDAFTPLIMSNDKYLAQSHTKLIKEKTNCQIPVYVGLFEPFIDGDTYDLLTQIQGARSSGASGTILFDYAHLNSEFQEALKTRVFGQK